MATADPSQSPRHATPDLVVSRTLSPVSNAMRVARM